MTENDDNSVEFSVVHKRRDRFEKNNDPHQCKTICKNRTKIHAKNWNTRRRHSQDKRYHQKYCCNMFAHV